MPFLSIDTQACLQDGLCRDVCPANLIEFTKGEYPRPVPEIETLCVRCGHCVAVCPADCLTHAEIPREQCLEIQKNLDLSEPAVAQFIKSRRSIREFKNKPVSRPAIEKIMDTVRFAPSGHNDQNVCWSIYDNPERLKSISTATVDFLRSLLDSTAGEGFPDGFQELIAQLIAHHEKGADPILRAAPVLTVAHHQRANPMAAVNCFIGLTTLELAAKGCGLGTCWIGFVMMAAQSGCGPLLRLLDLPADHQLAGAMVLGYPRIAYRRIPARKPAAIVWKD